MCPDGGNPPFPGASPHAMLVIGHLDKVVFFGPQMGPQMDPKMASQRDRKWVPKGTENGSPNGLEKGPNTDP